MIGVSLTLSLKKYTKNGNKWDGFKKITKRFIKLFIIGILTQGGIDLFDYNLKYIRIMGILQRVALCYYFGALIELFIQPKYTYSNQLTPTHSFVKNKNDNNLKKENNIVDENVQNNLKYIRYDNEQISAPSVKSGTEAWKLRLKQSFNIFFMYKYQYIVGLAMLILYIGLMYGVNVPNVILNGQIFPCGRGKLTPVCNAQSYIDQQIFSVNHMYFPTNGGNFMYNNTDVTFQRMRDCSTCYPGKCFKIDAPMWCYLQPFGMTYIFYMTFHVNNFENISI